MPATTQTITVLQQAQQPSGAFNSGSVDLANGDGKLGAAVVTANGDGSFSVATDPTTSKPFQFCFINFPMTDADASNVTNALLIYVGWSWDGGMTWDFTQTPLYSWIGGGKTKQGNPAAPSTSPNIPVKTIMNAVGQPVPSAPNRVLIQVDPQGLSLNHGIHVAFGD